MDATITYTGGFAETAANDGSVSGSVVMTLWGDTFTSRRGGRAATWWRNGMPAGLTAVFTRDSATQITMTLTGRATSHTGSDDVEQPGDRFRLFTAPLPSSAVCRRSRTRRRKEIGAVDFMDAAITYTGGFAETAANDGSVSGSVVMTLWGDTFTSRRGGRAAT